MTRGERPPAALNPEGTPGKTPVGPVREIGATGSLLLQSLCLATTVGSNSAVWASAKALSTT
jgi:hypothetical protein